LYKIGETVVYPMHGAGTIEKIEERVVMGETRSYYVLRIKRGNMEVMVPVDNAEGVGLRPIVECKDFDDVYSILAADSTEMDENWNRRNRDNMEKLKTGRLSEIAGVIRNLVRIDRVKKLSTGEKRLLNNAKLIMASEMEVVLNISEEAALEIIDSKI